MMRHKLRVANYMFRTQEHSFICQPPRGLASVMAGVAYLLREHRYWLFLEPRQGVEGHSAQYDFLPVGNDSGENVTRSFP